MNSSKQPTGAGSDDRLRVLYLLTDEISSVLVRGQLGHLAGHGFDVTVACRRADPVSPPEPGKWDDGVEVEHLPFVREPSPLADVRALWTTVRLIRRVQPVVVNASTPKAGLLGSVAAWLCRVPVRVYVVRGLRLETASGWRRRLFGALEWMAMRCANHVVFNSESSMAVAERHGLIVSARGEVIGGGSGNGIDLDRFADDALPSRADARERLGLPDGAVVVGFVGRFTRDKGISDLVDAFAVLCERSREFVSPPEVHEFTHSQDAGALWLLLVGQFEEGDPVSESTRRLIETHERILVVPWLEHTGVAYRAMDVLAFPSYREGLPNVPLEAQLCGVPVVGYAATGTVDAIGPGSVTVPLGDVGELADRLEAQVRAVPNRSSREHQGAEWVARRFRRETVWARLADRYRIWSDIAAGVGRNDDETWIDEKL